MLFGTLWLQFFSHYKNVRITECEEQKICATQAVVKKRNGNKLKVSEREQRYTVREHLL